MAEGDARQTELVDAKTQLPRYARDELDRKAEAAGMKRSTYLRWLVFRDLRERAA